MLLYRCAPGLSSGYVTSVLPVCNRTVKLAKQSGLADKVLSSGKGRATQMNAGAAAATGDLLCFLHADTVPPKDLVGEGHNVLTLCENWVAAVGDCRPKQI